MPFGQRLANVSPERRLGMLDLLDELLVSAADVLREVEAGKIRAPASLAGAGNLTKMLAEAAQAVLPTLECIRRRHELTGQTSS